MYIVQIEFLNAFDTTDSVTETNIKTENDFAFRKL